MITREDCKIDKEYDLKGLSTDVKPLYYGINSLFLELDTGDFYYFNGEAWNKVGGGTGNQQEDSGENETPDGEGGEN